MTTREEIMEVGADPRWVSASEEITEERIALLVMMDSGEDGMSEKELFKRMKSLNRIHTEALLFHMVWTGKLIFMGDGEDTLQPEPKFRASPEALKATKS